MFRNGVWKGLDARDLKNDLDCNLRKAKELRVCNAYGTWGRFSGGWRRLNAIDKEYDIASPSHSDGWIVIRLLNGEQSGC
jgi:hypothetical protein